MTTGFSLLGYLPLLVRCVCARTCIYWSSQSSFRLEARGLQILAVVSGWTSTNIKFWKLAGAGTFQKRNEDSVHPTMPNRDFVLQYPPHAFKCVRNQMYNQLITLLFR